MPKSGESVRTRQRKRKKEVEHSLSLIRSCSSEPVINTEQIFLNDKGSDLSLNFQLSYEPVVDLGNQISLEPAGDPIFDSPSNENADIKPSKFLRHWALKYNVSHDALRDLLVFLENSSNMNLPKDPRTLLRTPKSVTKFSLSNGECVYFDIRTLITNRLKTGIKKSSIPIVQTIESQLKCNLISIAVGIDGLPITKSTKKQFWPVLVTVDQSLSRSPFVAALYYGENKPNNSEFLTPFVNQCIELETFGIVFEGINYAFRISRILADAPARSFLKGVKNHNGYNACERCRHEGVSYLRRLVYPYEICEKRNDSDFINRDDDHFMSGKVSEFSKLSIGLVTQVPLDYLHLVCLGIVKRLLKTWVKGSLPHRIRGADVDAISVRLKSFRKFVPSCFQRKPRTLWDVDYYKGTEFRQILLYTGFPSLVGILKSTQLDHFILLHLAGHILLSVKADDVSWNNLAKELLHEFVKNFERIYGLEYVTYNVHSLIHLPDDSINFGRLDNASTFQFESFMQILKKLLRAKNLFVEQAFNRISELEATKLYDERVNENVVLSQKTGDNCFMLRNGELILVVKCTKVDGNLFNCCYKKFLITKKVKQYPVDSRKFGIYYTKNLSNNCNAKFKNEDVLAKYVCLPYKNSFFCMPLLHTVSQ